MAHIGAVPSAIRTLPAIDSNGAIENGYSSGSNYAVNGYGQNQILLNRSLNGFGSGTYQYGTATITSHPTLPISRWNDPVHGSGVAYYDPATHTINVGYSGDQGGFYVQAQASGEMKTKSYDLMGKIGVGLLVFGAVTAIAALVIATAAVSIPALGGLAVIVGIASVAASIAGILAGIFDYYNCEPYCAQPQYPSDFIMRNKRDTSFNAPSDGFGSGGEGVDQMYFAVQ